MSCTRLYYHAGDIGDAVYGMIVPKLLGAGSVWLGTSHELGDDLKPRVGFTRDSFEFLAPLLRRQAYVHDVGWVHRTPFCTHDLNRFRLHWRNANSAAYAARGWRPPHSLQQMHLAMFGCNDDGRQPWLTAERWFGPPVLFARSARYHNDQFPWKAIRDKYREIASFVGTDAEYGAFVADFGAVPRLLVRDAWHLACVVNGCRLFVGNQSAPYAIAEGLKVRTIQETRAGKDEDDCVFDRPNAQFVRDGQVTLPDL